MYKALPAGIPSVITTLAPTIGHYGYLAVGGLVLLEDFGVPVPGETTLIAAAVFAGTGRLNIFIVFFIAWFAAIIGDNIGFAIGEYGGHPLIERYGRYIFLTTERVGRAESFFNRHGGKVVVIARFVEGLRQANGIIAGLSDMKWLKFIIFNAIGAALWAGLWTGVGYFGGSHIGTVLKYEQYFAIAALVLIVSYLVWRVIKHRRHSNQATKREPPES